MTREEAIRELKIFSGTTRIRLSANFWEALNTVIKALEQESCEDAVSRQEVLKGYVEIERTDGVEIYSEKAVPTEYINNLPPVTPTRKKGKWKEIKSKTGTVIALRCNCCEKSPKHAIRSLYCPNCGVEMESE